MFTLITCSFFRITTMDVNDTSRQHHRNENTDSQNNTSSNNNDLLKCTCCRRLLPNRKTVIFNENKYNFNNNIVQASLSMQQTYRNMKEVMPQFITKRGTNNSSSCIPCTSTKQVRQMSPMPNPEF